MKVFYSAGDHLFIFDSSLTHTLEDVTDYICAGRVKYLCTLIDFCCPEQEFDERKLIIVFILIESRETSIIILVGSHPSVRPIDLVLKKLFKLSTSEVLLHLSIEDKQHSSVIDIGGVFELLTIRNSTILLNFRDKIVDAWFEFLGGFSCFQKRPRRKDTVPVSSIA